ncbi:DUF2795 domain-containing protein [Uliginosibacterium sp. sgz301328]|uniref:DUF2795 domain-containing protein n=1 Tax=Uliginosibacterium sp. sgz301328 TaxID=3243764 RepID=UPI00359EA3EA
MNQPIEIQVQKCLKGMDYPASADEIRRQADAHGASDEVREALKNLPDDEYRTPAQISKAIAHH